MPGKEIVPLCALLSALDIIITCDSLVAHLAGALGKPTLLIVPEIFGWRWIACEHQSRFYPSIHIIHHTNNDYVGAVAQIIEYIGRYSSTDNYDRIQ